MHLFDQFAENFVHLWNHTLAGAYKPLYAAQKFLVMVLWDYVSYSSTFLHLHHVWIIAILFSKCIALLSTNTKACQGVVRDSQPYIHITISSCSLASHTLRREEGSGHAATIELSHGRNLMWPIRSTLFVNRIRRHGIQLCHVFSGSQHFIT